jgi:hypothetical protein
VQSRAGKQELAILAAANAGIVSAISGYEIGNKDLRWQMGLVLGQVVDAIKQWPGADTHKDTKWAINRIKQWQAKLGGYDEGNSLSCLISITLQSVIDMEERIGDYDHAQLSKKDKNACTRKLELLKPIFEPLLWCNDFFDADGRNFKEMERADKILRILYEEIKFEW